MKIIFCGDPLHPNIPDSMYKNEYDAAKAVGLDVYLIAHPFFG